MENSILDIVFHSQGWTLKATQDGVELSQDGPGGYELMYRADEIYRAFEREPTIYLNGVLSCPDIGAGALDAAKLARWIGERFERHTSIAA